jgi:hypothetical protein
MSENDERRYRLALQNIVNALGPDRICECGPDEGPDCGLREEAAEALRLAKKALEHFELPRKHGVVFTGRKKVSPDYRKRFQFTTILALDLLEEGVAYQRHDDLRLLSTVEVMSGYEDFKPGEIEPPASVPSRLQPESIGLRIGR